MVKIQNISLELLHVACVVLFDELKHMAHGAVNYEKQGWAQVGQVDLLWTNIGAKKPNMGCIIEIIVLGRIELERKQCFNWNLFYLQLYQELVGPTVVAGNPWIVTISEVWLHALVNI